MLTLSVDKSVLCHIAEKAVQLLIMQNEKKPYLVIIWWYRENI